jgi:GntR family transcriptional regulator of arabinose operon
MKQKAKYQEIADILREELRGLVSGTKLPTEPLMAKRFNTSVLTLRNAINLLIQEKVVERIQGSGTFVLPPESQDNYQKIVLYCGICSGHMFQNLFDLVSRELNSQGYSPLVFNTTQTGGREQQKKLFNSLMSTNPQFILAIGTGDFPISLLEEYPGKLPPVFFVYRKEFVTTINCNEIIFDDVYMGNCLAEHFYNLGHRNIGFFAPDRFDPEIYSQHMREGIYSFAGQHRDLQITEILFDKDTFQSQIDNMIQKVKKRELSGIITISDHHAATLINSFKEHGLKIPEDVSISGYGNTPWAQDIKYNITTTDLKLEEMAKLIVFNLRRNSGKPKTWMIQPEIIQGKSTTPVNVSTPQ